MPIKKTKKKKSDADGSATEPDTVMSDGMTMKPPSAGKKKKKKKKKVSKEEKQRAKLDKLSSALRSSGAPYHYFLERMDRWLVQNARRAVRLFMTFDEEGEGLLSYEEFKAGMFDLEAPASATELHLLCQLLDGEEGDDTIEYMALGDGLAYIRERELDYEPADIRPALVVTKRNLEKCTGCKMPVWNGDNYQQGTPRYLELKLKLATFENFKNHPGHLTLQVASHTTVATVIERIREETGQPSSWLRLYQDSRLEARSMLPPQYSLERCGLAGGTADDPQTVDLFYDYKVEFKDCPVLMCDNYFLKDK